MRGEPAAEELTEWDEVVCGAGQQAADENRPGVVGLSVCRTSSPGGASSSTLAWRWPPSNH
jgi:hypothetical protein